MWPGPIYRYLSTSLEITGGAFFAGVEPPTPTEVFQAIDALEKSPVRGQILTRYMRLHGPWRGLALILLVMERLLSMAKLRRLP